MLLSGQKAVASHYGTSERNVRYWLEDPEFPRRPDGKFDTDAIDQWRASRPKMLSQQADNQFGQANAVLGLKLKEQKLKTETEKALKAQREREAFEGELLPRRAWETFAATLLSELADWCDQLPELAELQVPKKHGIKLRKWLESQLDMRRVQLADELKQGPRGEKS